MLLRAGDGRRGAEPDLLHVWSGEGARGDGVVSAAFLGGDRGHGFSGECVQPRVTFSRFGRHPGEPTEREREMWEMRRQGLTFAVIGARFGLSRQRVQQILARYQRQVFG